MKYLVILLVLVGFAGTAWAEVALSAEPTSAKFGDDIIIHASVSSYDDALRYYIDVINPAGQQIDSTLWFVREDFDYTMRTVHPAYQILRGGEFTIQAEQAINNIERTGNIVQTTSFFLSNPPPLYQLKGGIMPENVICNNELVLLQKYDGSPACVKPFTIPKLIEREWVSNEFLESLMNTFTLDTEKGIFEIQYFITGAELSDISSDVDINSVVITLDKSKTGYLTIALPKPLANLILGYCDENYNKNVDPTFFILVDGKEVEFNVITSDQEQILIIPFQEDTRKMEITVGCLI